MELKKEFVKNCRKIGVLQVIRVILTKVGRMKNPTFSFCFRRFYFLSFSFIC